MTAVSPAWERVRGYTPTSFCDWPGKVSAVLFVADCNLRCPTCHNSGLAWNWKVMPVLDREVLFADLTRRKRWLDGLTLSGGEPSLLFDLPALLTDLQSLGLQLKLDSNGLRPEVLTHVLATDLVQTVAVDVKGPWALYPALTGGMVSAGEAYRALDAVFALGLEYPGRVYFRCTKVPLLEAGDLVRVRDQVPAGLELRFQDFIQPGNKKYS